MVMHRISHKACILTENLPKHCVCEKKINKLIFKKNKLINFELSEKINKLIFKKK